MLRSPSINPHIKSKVCKFMQSPFSNTKSWIIKKFDRAYTKYYKPYFIIENITEPSVFWMDDEEIFNIYDLRRLCLSFAGIHFNSEILDVIIVFVIDVGKDWRLAENLRILFGQWLGLTLLPNSQIGMF